MASVAQDIAVEGSRRLRDLSVQERPDPVDLTSLDRMNAGNIGLCNPWRLPDPGESSARIEWVAEKPMQDIRGRPANTLGGPPAPDNPP